MIKQMRASYFHNFKNAQYCALSDDPIPNDLENGDEVYIIDQGKIYYWDASSSSLYEYKGGQGGSGGSSSFIPCFGSLGTVALGTTWSGNDPYTSTVTVTGYTVTDQTMVSVLPSEDVIEQMLTDGITNIFITNNDGVLTATAIGAVPTVPMTLQVLCTESDISGDIAELPSIVGSGIIETVEADNLTDAINILGEDVNELKNAISQLATKKYVADATGNADLTGGFDYGFIWLYMSTVDVTAVQTSSTVKYIVVECSAGDQFTLMGTEPSGSTGRLYAFVAADGTRLSYSNDSLSKYTVITAPTNTAYLVVDVVADAPYGLYSGALINITVASVDDVVENVQNRFVLSTSIPGYLTTSGGIGAQDSTKKERTSDFIPITSDSIALQLWGNITEWWCTVGFYDVNKQWISRYGQTNPTNKNGRLIKTVTVPSNIGAAYYRVSTRFYADGKLMITDSPSEVLPAFKYALDDYLLVGNIDSIIETKNMLATGLRHPLLMPPKPRCLLHRGAALLAPENTMPAFEIAAESGVWGIETDVYETTDGYFVLSHDDDVSRMTDGTGKITEMTYAQTQECTIDAGANIDQYPGLKMPTLDAYLKLCRDNGCVACVEIKGITHYDSFVNAIRSAGMEGSCIILIYYNATKINTLRNLTPIPINLIYSTGLNINTAVAEAKSFSDLWIDLYSTTVTAEVVKTAHVNNIPVNTWTYNTKADAQNGFINYGLDLITVATYAD